MTTPIPGFEEVEPLAEPNYYRLRISDTTQGAAIGTALAIALANGLIHYGAPEARRDPTTGAVSWTVKITDPNGVDKFADQGDYIVLTYHGDQMCCIELQNGPDGKYNNPRYSDTFPEEETGS